MKKTIKVRDDSETCAREMGEKTFMRRCYSLLDATYSFHSPFNYFSFRSFFFAHLLFFQKWREREVVPLQKKTSTSSCKSICSKRREIVSPSAALLEFSFTFPTPVIFLLLFLFFFMKTTWLFWGKKVRFQLRIKTPEQNTNIERHAYRGTQGSGNILYSLMRRN